MTFIVFDGLDGSGKGEMITRLARLLESRGKKVLVTKEPTDGDYGKQARAILQSESDPRSNAEQCLDLFLKDREEHISTQIQPHLNSGGVVICDRYTYSTIAFQYTQGLELQRLIDLNNGFLKPDIALILDVGPEVAFGRIENRGKDKEKFEELEFMKELRKNFLELQHHLEDNIVIVDANLEIGDVFEKVTDALSDII